jgi:hypothetical protein
VAGKRRAKGRLTPDLGCPDGVHVRPGFCEFAITNSDVTAMAAACQARLTGPSPSGKGTPPSIGIGEFSTTSLRSFQLQLRV